MNALGPLVPSFTVATTWAVDVLRLVFVFGAAVVVPMLVVRIRRDWRAPDRRPALLALLGSIVLDLFDELEQIGRPFTVYRLPVRFAIVGLSIVYATRRTRDDARRAATG